MSITHHPFWDAKRYATDLAYRAQVGAQYLERAAFNQPCNLIVGAEGKGFPGYTITDKEYLDITDTCSWDRYFRSQTVDSVLAEHVFEHLTDGEIIAALELMYIFLVTQGKITISVPDGFHPDPDYIEQVVPGGTGPGADDHKQLFNIHSLRNRLENAGFLVIPIEYWDNQGVFHRNPDCPERKVLRRTFDKDLRNRTGEVGYTSLILQGVKA